MSRRTASTTLAASPPSADTAHFRWAFAQDIDNTFNRAETCRESLAKVLYDPRARDRLRRVERTSNLFLFSGEVEGYRIHAFRTQGECEMVLTAMMARFPKR